MTTPQADRTTVPAALCVVRIIRVALSCGACGSSTTITPMTARAWAAAHVLPQTDAVLLSVNGGRSHWHRIQR